ncbi:NADH-flavin reductase [Frondihabitans sucicola]|uniref:NADH-flavin reductase n=1 Tax=Frondihabitans sucicola TaxID=1268041 RepID=A0ABN6XW38_9MICO|nr:NAD(P)-binding oxidoreductase [Frondihabitans sucicola]BDZ49189.1 NADH-flavin reductase [Frondihabitans sucicola]
MRVLVLGATGGTGRHVLEQAISAGHEVTALVRDPTKLGTIEGIRSLTGDATNTVDVRAALDGQQAVLNALGSRSLTHPVEAASTAILVPEAEKVGIERLIVCSAFGVGETRDGANASQRAFFSTMLGRVYSAKEVADAAVRASNLDWTLVYPTRLTNTPPTGRILAVESFAGVGRVSRADVARFMVEQLDSAAWSRQTVIVSGR